MNTYKNGFGIIIFESLEDSDKKTGQILYSSILKYKTFEENELSTIYKVIDSKSDFYSEIEKLVELIVKENFFPIIQIDTHGSELGIVCRSGEIISWSELFSKTRELNVLLQNRLLIILSMCFGLNVLEFIEVTDRSPFGAIIGITTEIEENNLLAALEAFYENFLFTFSIPESVSLMNNQLIDKENFFYFLTSENCFEKIVSLDKRPENFEYLINHFSIEEKAVNPEFINQDFSVVKRATKEKLKKLQMELSGFRDYFLMNDLKNSN